MARYLEVASELRRRIRKGAYALGAAIPVRSELSREFNVARATLDRGVQTLVDEGLLRARRGSGTVVARDGAVFRVGVIGHFELAPMVPHPAFDFTVLHPSRLAHRSERDRLGRFEGLIWHMPEIDALAWAREWRGKRPQIVVNREAPDLDYVSTDHRGAIQRLVSRRIAELPDALPVFLAIRSPRPMVDELRQEGFVAACRDVRRYHETIFLDRDFEGRVKALEPLLSWRGRTSRPLLLVSGFMAHTGAVMVWQRSHGLRWRRDLWYSDFDDASLPDVWGVRVTSFIQDYQALFRRATECLLAKLEGATDPVRELVDPVFVEGDT